MDCAAAPASGFLQELARNPLAFLFPAFLPFVILPVVMQVLARTGGWAALAARYPMLGTPPPALVTWGYCVFRRWCGYNGCLILAADHQGLFMRLWPFFSIGHAPVHIPWSEIREIRRETMWCRPIYRVVTVRAPELDFAFHGRTWKLLRPAVEAARVAIVES